jgi:hypothetical protein
MLSNLGLLVKNLSAKAAKKSWACGASGREETGRRGETLKAMKAASPTLKNHLCERRRREQIRVSITTFARTATQV